MARKERTGRFKALLNNCTNIQLMTRWREALQIFSALPAFQSDSDLQAMDMVDFLSVYEDHIRSLEDAFYAQKDEERKLKRQQESYHRQAFKVVLASIFPLSFSLCFMSCLHDAFSRPC